MTKHLVKSFLKDQSGATAIEYGMMVSLFSLVMLVWWNASADGINFQFGEVSGVLEGQTSTGTDDANVSG